MGTNISAVMVTAGFSFLIFFSQIISPAKTVQPFWEGFGKTNATVEKLIIQQTNFTAGSSLIRHIRSHGVKCSPRGERERNCKACKGDPSMIHDVKDHPRRCGGDCKWN